MGHTPGPWKYDDWSQAISSPSGWVATIGERERKSDVPFGSRDDDGNLIAAAPEMLAACEVAIDALGCDRIRQDRLNAQRIIKAAIAKARGEAVGE